MVKIIAEVNKLYYEQNIPCGVPFSISNNGKIRLFKNHKEQENSNGKEGNNTTKASKLGYKNVRTKILSEEQIKELIFDYLNNMSYSEIERKYSISHGTCVNVLKQAGIKRKRITNIRRG